ncbi:MAG: hypothetical protein AABY22_01190 [Nanoarchaeota archaeon]
MSSKRGEKAQVTIFVIIALLVIVLVIALIIFRKDILPATFGSSAENPEEYIDSCIKDKVQEAADILIENGGYINPELNITLDGKETAYLCYTSNYYRNCVNQNPMLITSLENEIKNYIRDDLNNCFQDLKIELQDKGYSVALSEGNFDVELSTRRVVLNIDREISFSKAEESRRVENFRSALSHPIYDLAIVAQEIVSQEVKYCNFESVGFMLLYSDFNIKRFKTGTLSTVYTVTHKPTEKQFKFAVRGCVIPPGF